MTSRTADIREAEARGYQEGMRDAAEAVEQTFIPTDYRILACQAIAQAACVQWRRSR